MIIDFGKHLGMEEENRMTKVLIRKADRKPLLHSSQQCVRYYVGFLFLVSIYVVDLQ